MWTECMRFAFVAIVVAPVIISAGWWWMHDPGWTEISLREVASSNLVPLDAVVVFRFALRLFSWSMMVEQACAAVRWRLM
jgi:hypothetical protein